MAVTVTDRRLTIDVADTTTGWTNTGGGTLGSTTNPAGVDGTCLSEIVSKTNTATYHTHGTGIDADSSNTGSDQESSTAKTFNGLLIYMWVFQRGAPLTTSAGGLGVVVGDGTNTMAYYVAGNDEKGFSHDSVSPYFQCMVIDTNSSELPSSKGTVAGSEGSMSWGALTQFGGWADNGTEKAVGGVANYFWDAVRVGNWGLRIAGGTTGARGTFVEIATADEATSGAYGVFRALSSGLYGAQSALTFGSTSADSYFEDSDFVLVFEDRPVADDKFFIDVEGDSGSTNVFILTNGTIKSAGPAVKLDFTNADINTLTLTGCLFADLKNSILFSNSTTASGHSVTGCTFNNIDQIDPGDVTFEYNTISNYQGSTSGALLLDADGTDNWTDLSFKSFGTGHAIYITAAGEYDFTNFTYDNYASSDGSTGNEVIYNNSGGTVTLNISGGDTPTVRNGTGANTVLVIDPVTLGITVIDSADSTAVVGASVYVRVSDGTNFPYQDSVTIASSGTTATVTHTGHGLSTDDKIYITGANETPYNGVFTITLDGADPTNKYTYTMGSSTTSPATGTITATFVLIYGVTNASGYIGYTQSYSDDQPIVGRVRRATSGTLYKNSAIAGTISKTGGLGVTVQMIPD
jgi:hypothetical protein